YFRLRRAERVVRKRSASPYFRRQRVERKRSTAFRFSIPSRKNVNTFSLQSFRRTRRSAATEFDARQQTKVKPPSRGGGFTLVRVERIELSSQVWKTCILTVVLHPQSMTNIVYTINRVISKRHA